ncbi:MAG: glycine oxidase ThiO [Firmicutes bacterium]|nr:glycine oxidase ThiO [Bacillota bacterium]
MPHRYDWIVVGAGIIGSLTAWRLGQGRARVALVDAGPPGQKASGAAAGILSPSAEALEPGPLADLARASLLRYPDTVAAVVDDAVMDVGYERTGVVQSAWTDDEVAALRARWDWQRDWGVRWLDGAEAERLMPERWPVQAALLAEDEGQVHPPQLVAAAVRAGARRGVGQFFGQPARLLVEGTRAVGVSLPDATLWAEGGVIVAAGAWSGLLLQEVGLQLPVVPIRGQIASFTVDAPWLQRILFHGHTYAVPKRDGRVVIGATEDAVGFDDRVTAAGLARLGRILESLHVPLEALHLERIWAGLRPRSADGLPLLGPWPGLDGLYVATGHFRNGVLLAPITAEVVTDWVLGRKSAVDLAPFDPGRFAKLR